MSHLNQVLLIGNLGKNPEILKTTEQGDFVRLSLATSKRYNNKQGEKQEETQWHVVYLTNRLGRVASTYLKKGDKIFVSGELRTREWFDDDGLRHFNTSIYARELKFLSVKPIDASESYSKSNDNDGTYEQAIQEIRESLGNHLLVN